eukprot:TRINITY_DN2864_c0_g1_i1.p1 TRINITY_DN2864_c0_g1~~TRINITY_DN2864_c0_g1_i1.p1  ORF type:complete len:523 (+),score=90.63 TRINITY_DN2864_c0_g1_i1:106-1569(+)
MRDAGGGVQVVGDGVYTLVPTEDKPGGDASPATDGAPPTVSMEFYAAQVGAARAFEAMRSLSSSCDIPKDSVYGFAMAMPQLARSAGWPSHYVGFVVRAYCFLFINLFLQSFLLYMISTDERILSKFGGQMHLCDFGASLDSCPDGPDCIGPGGTTYSADRLFGWSTWSTRVYVRDALKAVFPDQAETIDRQVDPGEYGLQSGALRYVCCFLFVSVCWPDLQGSYDLFHLLWNVPTAGEMWIECKLNDGVKEAPSVPLLPTMESHASSTPSAPAASDDSPAWRFHVAGMPLGWKLVNFLLIVLPKVYVWLLAVDIGVVFLMETAGCEDLIINSVALSFILSIDELICHTLVAPVVKRMLNLIEPYRPPARPEPSDQAVYEAHQYERSVSCCSFLFWWHCFPSKPGFVVITTCFFIWKYYTEHCVQSNEEGGWISQPVQVPGSLSLPLISFVFGPFPALFPIETTSLVLWPWANGFWDTDGTNTSHHG